MKPFVDWFHTNNWTPLPFQQEAWRAILSGKDGMICVPTGAGKTYAAYLPALANVESGKGTQILYITPLRALARDLEFALRRPVEALDLNIQVEKRTGDTTTAARKKQLKKPPEVLLTTPESLSLMLTTDTAFNHLKMVIIDEWHELLGSKRGVLLQFALSHLKAKNPQLQIWGLTATIGNLQEAAAVCVGNDRVPVIISSSIPRDVILKTVLPEKAEQLPWAGFFGLRMLPYLLGQLNIDTSTLIFTNTRAQAERWHQALIEALGTAKHLIALHHSSIDKHEREEIETKVKNGLLKWVVCTSSLDLGVDFSTVEQVIQIGSPKSIARLLQRAGRSAHRPLMPCRLTLVPTHALELTEMIGYRLALNEQAIEKRTPLYLSYDVLMQHITSMAIGKGFNAEDLFNEIKTTASFKDLTWEAFEHCLLFLTTGGKALTAYPEYKKLQREGNHYSLNDRKLIQRHRLNIGTITSDAHIPIKMARGKSLGMVEENFIAGMKPGDAFLFGGKALELVQYRGMTAYVRPSKSKTIHSAVWQGSRLPFSAPLGHYLRKSFTQLEHQPESALAAEILEIQKRLSHVPLENETLVEIHHNREGWHLCLYPFEGKVIHQGLGYLLADRLAKQQSATFTISANDYGVELLSNEPITEEMISLALFEKTGEAEIAGIQNLHELGRSFFRDIARISGLIFQGYPTHQKTNRQIQASSGLIYEVFTKYDAENVLVKQARQEVFDHYFDLDRLQSALERMHQSTLVVKTTKRFTPFSLPLYIERTSGQLSTEDLADRIEKIKKQWTTTK